MKKLSILLALVLATFSAFGQTPNIHLNGRSVVGNLPRPVYNVQKEGIVVVAITIDQYGKVIKAVPGADGTTIKDQALWSAARKAAMESHFNASNDPTPTQGTITYNFILEESSSSSRVHTIPVQQNPAIQEDIDQSAIQFLGIPVDGSKDNMVAQLIGKGFRREYEGRSLFGLDDSNDSNQNLVGQFNGESVMVSVHTYHDRVDRIIVEFSTVQEMNLREQYNQLLYLLTNNEKYMPIAAYSPIPEDEDCNYEIAVNKKDYKTRFSYSPDGEVLLAIFGYHVCLYYDNLKNRPHGEDL